MIWMSRKCQTVVPTAAIQHHLSLQQTLKHPPFMTGHVSYHHELHTPSQRNTKKSALLCAYFFRTQLSVDKEALSLFLPSTLCAQPLLCRVSGGRWRKLRDYKDTNKVETENVYAATEYVGCPLSRSPSRRPIRYTFGKSRQYTYPYAHDDAVSGAVDGSLGPRS